MTDTPKIPRHHPDDIVLGPWGVKHGGELNDPTHRCDDADCGCHYVLRSNSLLDGPPAPWWHWRFWWARRPW